MTDEGGTPIAGAGGNASARDLRTPRFAVFLVVLREAFADLRAPFFALLRVVLREAFFADLRAAFQDRVLAERAAFFVAFFVVFFKRAIVSLGAKPTPASLRVI